MDEIQLSVSTGTLVSNCEQKAVFHKVLKADPDPDYEEDSEALIVGSAFHEVLENTLHTSDFLTEQLESVATKYELAEDKKALIHGMCIRYINMHKKSGLRVVACEMELSTPIFLGYIDAIMDDEEGNWWIVDLKTAKSLWPSTVQKLPTDFQLCMYSSFKETVAKKWNLDVNKFQGTRYRSTIKPRLLKGDSESYETYVKRIFKSCKAYDIKIPESIMKIDEAVERHKILQERLMELAKGESKPRRNLSYCDSYFRPCKWWSRCHGVTYSESADQIEIEVEG